MAREATVTHVRQPARRAAGVSCDYCGEQEPPASSGVDRGCERGGQGGRSAPTQQGDPEGHGTPA